MRRWLILLPLLVGACAPFTASRSATEPAAQVTLQGIRDVSVQEAKSLIDQGLTVIDVRTAEEFSAGHIPGARNLPLAELSSWSSTLSKDAPYAVICFSGGRSTRAVKELEARGFRRLRNVQGGMFAWEGEGYPVTPAE